MKFTHKLGFGALFGALALAGIAVAQQVVLPQVTVVGNGDLIQDIVGGAPGVPNQYITAATLAGYTGALPAKANLLIGGDATQNLWQRATTGSAVTTTVTYGGPDRWAYWSGTSTQIKVIRSSTAGDLPAVGYQYAFKLQRTAAQTGVVQSCMAQEVESTNSYQLQGAVAELDFHATAGANFSAASNNVTAYIITGTGTDEGMTNLAFGLNGGGGGSAGWTGQANATAAVIPISSATGRYAAVASIPATATEAAVALCYTPVGTAGANDYAAFSGIQLVRNASLATSVSATVGYQCSPSSGGTGQPGIQCTSFDRTRLYAIEQGLQQRYYAQINESATALNIRAPCAMSTSSIANCLIQFPVSMRVAPTMTYTAGFEASATTASTSATVCTALTTTATLTGNAASTQGVLVDCASSAGFGAAGTAGWLWDIGTGSATGIIKASAEL